MKRILLIPIIAVIISCISYGQTKKASSPEANDSIANNSPMLNNMSGRDTIPGQPGVQPGITPGNYPGSTPGNNQSITPGINPATPAITPNSPQNLNPLSPGTTPSQNGLPNMTPSLPDINTTPGLPAPSQGLPAPVTPTLPSNPNSPSVPNSPGTPNMPNTPE